MLKIEVNKTEVYICLIAACLYLFLKDCCITNKQ
jgi:hypothetical protein